MRRVALGTLVLAFTAVLARPAAADEFFAPDKLSHFGTSAGVGVVADTVAFHYVPKMGPVGRTLAATAAGTATGLIVEIVDSTTGHGFSAGDLAADALGAATGALSSELFNGAFFVSASNREIKIGMRW
ncbi:MAG TPA: hypothetical protein VNE71_08125 [Myxococcota bacterium]|jgi:hypothetical protein|nr:hypothetical protein [Myxococcota bacterium]